MSETTKHRCSSEITRSGKAWRFRGADISFCPLCGVHLDTLARVTGDADDDVPQWVVDGLLATVDAGLLAPARTPNATRVEKKAKPPVMLACDLCGVATPMDGQPTLLCQRCKRKGY